MSVHVKVAPNGRVSLPAEVRRQLGLQQGGDLYLQVTDDGLILRTVEQAVRRAQALSREMLKNHPNTSVDDFLAERRREAQREEERDARLHG